MLSETAAETAARFIALRHKTKGLVRGLCSKCRAFGHDAELCFATRRPPQVSRASLSEEGYLIALSTGAPFRDIAKQLGLAASTLFNYWKIRSGGAPAPSMTRTNTRREHKELELQALMCSVATGASFRDVAPQFGVDRQAMSRVWGSLYPGELAPSRARIACQRPVRSLTSVPRGTRARWAAEASVATGMSFSDIAGQFDVNPRAIAIAWRAMNPSVEPPKPSRPASQRTRMQLTREAVSIAVATGMSFSDLAHQLEISSMEIAVLWGKRNPGCPEPAELRVCEAVPVPRVPISLRCKGRLRINQATHACIRHHDHAGLHDAGIVKW